MIITNLSQELENLTDWFRANKLSLNINKTNYIIFTKTPNLIPAINLKLGGEIIHRVDCTKFLGTYIYHDIH